MIRRSTLILFSLFVLLLAGTLIWQKYQKKSEETKATPTSATSPLIGFDEASIVTIALQDNLNRLVKLQRTEDGAWNLKYPPSDTPDIDAINTAVNQLKSVQISSIPQNIPSLESVGLDEPPYSIMIVRKDGSQFLINVGNMTPTESGYYVLTPDRVIYIVSKYNLDNFFKMLDTPPIVQTPTPSMAVPEILEFPAATGTP